MGILNEGHLSGSYFQRRLLSFLLQRHPHRRQHKCCNQLFIHRPGFFLKYVVVDFGVPEDYNITDKTNPAFYIFHDLPMMIKRILLTVLLIAFLAMYIVISAMLPDVAVFKYSNPGKTSFMKYREKQWQKQGKKIHIYQVWTPIAEISPYLIKAVIIAEDDKFWSHGGFDMEAIEKAIKKDWRKKKLKMGASTITQQLAKNLFLSPSKNPVRKLKEAILTIRLERALSKKRIIELYLNVVEWGEGVFGAGAAARYYYGKSASALTAEESARLAAVLPNPRKYSPAGSSRYVNNRANHIYRIMVKRGFIIPEYESVMSETWVIPEDIPMDNRELPGAETSVPGE